MLSRSRERTRENVREADQAKLSEPQKQDHIQYLDQLHIRAMLASAEAEKEREAKAKRSSNDILREMFGDPEKSPRWRQDIDESQQLERDRGMER